MSASDQSETSNAVTNSTCLIGLERIERLDILPQVFSNVVIPTAVATEVGMEADWLMVRTVQNLAVAATLKNSGRLRRSRGDRHLLRRFYTARSHFIYIDL